MGACYSNRMEGESRLKILAGILFALTTVIAAAWVLLSPAKERMPRPGFAFDGKLNEQIAGQFTGRGPEPQERSSTFGLVEQPREPGRRPGSGEENGPGSGAEPGRDPAQASASASTSAGKAPGSPDAMAAAAKTVALGAEERSALAQAAGDVASPEHLRRLGEDSTLLTRAATGLLNYPKAMRWLLDQPLLVKSFMSFPAAQRKCRDSGALANFLADPANPRGEKMYRAVFKSSLDDPKASSALLGSRLAEAILDCPGVKSLVSDSEKVQGILTQNLDAAMLIMDPRTVEAISKVPGAAAPFKEFRRSMGPDASPSVRGAPQERK